MRLRPPPGPRDDQLPARPLLRGPQLLSSRRDPKHRDRRETASHSSKVLERWLSSRIGWVWRREGGGEAPVFAVRLDRKSTRLNSSHLVISYAVFCLKKKNKEMTDYTYRPMCV